MDDLRREGFERAFIALHGRYGEDGTVQGALELLRIPYTGSGVMASAIAMDKVRTKQIWIAQRPADAALPDGQRRLATCAKLARALGLPLIVKPAHEGSTIGLTQGARSRSCPPPSRSRPATTTSCSPSEFVDGRELTVAVLGAGDGARALPVIEIRAPEGNYDYQNKYFTDDTRVPVPGAAPRGARRRRSRRWSLAAYRALRCSGWGRVDLMLDARRAAAGCSR